MVGKQGGAAGQVVVTTIQAPTPSLEAMAKAARAHGAGFIVAGDRKTPDAAWPQPCDYWSLQRQTEAPWRLMQALPQNHYGRKNAGYLAAIASGAAYIFDTDDDNAPEPGWRPRAESVSALRCLAAGWVNAYAWFTREHVWPRGLHLPAAHDARPPAATGETEEAVHAPIQQGLANGSPDVDAVWRLLHDRPLTFDSSRSVLLPPGSWCPFNSQSTWWFPKAWPLLYLPSHVSFRMTDIWRSFVAQRCLWAMGHGVVFHGAEMFQDRNEHNLMRDFEQEVPGYLHNDRIRTLLEDLPLDAGDAAAGANLHRCYEALVRAAIVPQAEMPLVEAWLADVGSLT